jgi:[ribosomal protein S5]-alanine N-acetyltransferase
MPAQIVGSRIVLRKLKLADAPTVYRIMQNPKVTRYLFVGQPYRKAHAVEFIRKIWSWWRLRKSFGYAIVLKETGELIGSIGLMRVDWSNRSGEIGYSIGEQYWGHGYMSETVALITNAAFRTLQLERVFARVFVGNTASERVLEKVGFSLEGTLRRHHHKEGRWFDMQYFAVLRSEWDFKRIMGRFVNKRKSAGRK